jgi:hypothetical protein
MNWLLAVISLLIAIGICYISYIIRDMEENDEHFDD